MREFIITTVTKIRVPDTVEAESEALKQWDDVAWRHYGVQTASDLRRVLMVRCAEVGKGRGFSRENVVKSVHDHVESAAVQGAETTPLPVVREAGC